MFFKDPSGELPRSAICSCITNHVSGMSDGVHDALRAGNSLEFKAMTSPENLFAKYHVTS